MRRFEALSRLDSLTKTVSVMAVACVPPRCEGFQQHAKFCIRAGRARAQETDTESDLVFDALGQRRDARCSGAPAVVVPADATRRACVLGRPVIPHAFSTGSPQIRHSDGSRTISLISGRTVRGKHQTRVQFRRKVEFRKKIKHTCVSPDSLFAPFATRSLAGIPVRSLAQSRHHTPASIEAGAESLSEKLEGQCLLRMFHTVGLYSVDAPNVTGGFCRAARAETDVLRSRS